MSDECCKPEWNDKCCCNCISHVADFHHCTTSPELRESNGKCCCSVQKGWICMTDRTGERQYSGWSEHGMCEMWMRKPTGS